jgi:hypothetical protein
MLSQRVGALLGLFGTLIVLLTTLTILFLGSRNGSQDVLRGAGQRMSDADDLAPLVVRVASNHK